MSEQTTNPYAPPAAIVSDRGNQFVPNDGSYIPGGRSRDAGDSSAWIGAGWDSFKNSPGTWVLLSLILFVLWWVTSLIPFGNLIGWPLNQILLGSLMIACENQRREGVLKIADLLAGFQHKLAPLLVLGLINFGLGLLVTSPLLVTIGPSAIGLGEMDPAAMMNLVNSFKATPGLYILLGLFMTVTGTLVASATWFAPALIVLHDQSPLNAMKSSFTGCWRNWLPGLIYFILLGLLMLLSMIPLLLGLLIWFPLMWASIYTAYRSIFIET